MAALSFFGLAMGLGAVAYVLYDGGIFAIFVSLNSFILVFGGTIGAAMITYPWKLIRSIPWSIWLVFFPRPHKDPHEVIEHLMDIQQVAYTGSIDDIDINAIDDRFLQSGLRLLLEEQREEDIQEELETELVFARQRSRRTIDLFRTMADFAPVFGLLGTLIGIVQVLKHLGNPEEMGSYMALAITTTFYGIFGSNFVFLPTAGKLEGYSDDGAIIQELIIMGILSIYRKERPSVMRRRLQRFIAPRMQKN